MLVDTVRATIRWHQMLAGGETVLVAVSGGPDSVALLHLLMTLTAELSLRLHVLHVDHGLRPDSEGDAAFVRGLAARLGVPVEPVEAVGWDGDFLEAQCFGYLAVRSARGLPLSLPTTTGVPRPMSGGELHRAAA